MQEIASRLRAALTPNAAMLLAALLLVFLFLSVGEQDSLESRVERTLSCVDGAGRVEVTIMMRDASASGAAFGMEKDRQTPCGAVAVAQGADDPLVAIALHDALCALLGLPPSSVSVMTGGK